MFNAKIKVLFVLLAGGLAVTSAQADMIDLGTAYNASNWAVTAYGDDGVISANQPSFQVSGNWISITSTGRSGGQWISGANNSEFNGLWVATSSFIVPDGAEDISFTFSNLSGDDRVVFELNGHLIGAATPNHGGSGPGVMTYPVTGNAATTFSTTFGDASQYVVIGNNTLRLIINNTNSATNLSAATRNLNGTGDATNVAVDAILNYVPGISGPVTPDPATLSLLVLGAIGVLRKRANH